MLMVLLTAMTLSSCSFMTEDLPECENIVSLVFKYDYNIEDADMFHDHVGYVRLFVIDNETDMVVKDTTVSNRDDFDAIKDNGNRYYKMRLNGLVGDRSYRFVAFALQRPYDETQRQGSDNFVGTFPQLHTDVKALKMNLTHNPTHDSEGRNAVTAPENGLDTLWMGHTDKAFYVPQFANENSEIADTISMVRDTKYLQLLIHQLDNPANISSDDYEIEIVSQNANLDWNNDVLASPTLLYSPHFARTLESVGKDANDQDVVLSRTAFYEISFSRLMNYTKSEEFAKNARLRIFLKATADTPRKLLVDLHLPHALAEGRSMYKWLKNKLPKGVEPEQDYLDREYKYRLDFYFKGTEVKDIQLISTNIVPWSIRIQYNTL